MKAEELTRTPLLLLLVFWGRGAGGGEYDSSLSSSSITMSGATRAVLDEPEPFRPFLLELEADALFLRFLPGFIRNKDMFSGTSRVREVLKSTVVISTAVPRLFGGGRSRC